MSDYDSDSSLDEEELAYLREQQKGKSEEPQQSQMVPADDSDSDYDDSDEDSDMDEDELEYLRMMEAKKQGQPPPEPVPLDPISNFQQTSRLRADTKESMYSYVSDSDDSDLDEDEMEFQKQLEAARLEVQKQEEENLHKIEEELERKRRDKEVEEKESSKDDHQDVAEVVSEKKEEAPQQLENAIITTDSEDEDELPPSVPEPPKTVEPEPVPEEKPVVEKQDPAPPKMPLPPVPMKKLPVIDSPAPKKSIPKLPPKAKNMRPVDEIPVLEKKKEVVAEKKEEVIPEKKEEVIPEPEKKKDSKEERELSNEEKVAIYRQQQYQYQQYLIAHQQWQMAMQRHQQQYNTTPEMAQRYAAMQQAQQQKIAAGMAAVGSPQQVQNPNMKYASKYGSQVHPAQAAQSAQVHAIIPQEAAETSKHSDIGEPTWSKVGWLEKRGGSMGGRKSWKRRYFSLKGSKLSYYKHANFSEDSLGELNLTGASVRMVPEEESEGREYCFALQHLGGKDMLFAAGQKQEMIDWLKIFRKVIQHQKRRAYQGTSALVLEGTLLKRAGSSKWHERWFKFQGNKNSGRMQWYRSQNDETPIGIVPVEDIISCGPSEIHDLPKQYRGCGFVIQAQKRTFYLAAKSQEEMKTWVNRIVGFDLDQSKGGVEKQIGEQERLERVLAKQKVEETARMKTTETGEKSISCGFLTKQGGKRGGAKTWKRRYFILDGQYLFYFKDMAAGPNDPSKLGEIRLEETTVQQATGEEAGGRDFVITIRRKGHPPFLCQADSDLEMRQWLSVLRKTASYYKRLEFTSKMITKQLPVIEGQLYKHNPHGLKSWTNRWFKLNGDTLHIYKEYGTKKILGEIPIGTVASCMKQAETEKHPGCGLIIYHGKGAERPQGLIVSAPTPDDAENWVKHINKYMIAVQNPDLAIQQKIVQDVTGKSDSEKVPDTMPRLSGMLSKRGTTGLRQFKSRYFYISGNNLIYSKDEGAKPLGEISLKEIESVKKEDVSGRMDCCFLIRTREKSYSIAAKTPSECSHWIKTLNEAVKFASKSHRKYVTPLPATEIVRRTGSVAHSPAPAKPLPSPGGSQNPPRASSMLATQPQNRQIPAQVMAQNSSPQLYRPPSQTMAGISQPTIPIVRAAGQTVHGHMGSVNSAPLQIPQKTSQLLPHQPAETLPQPPPQAQSVSSHPPIQQQPEPVVEKIPDPYQGPLTLRAGLGWKTRFCRIQGDYLNIYKKESDSDPLESINLVSLHPRLARYEDSATRENCIVLEDPEHEKEDTLLQAGDPMAVNKWLGHLKKMTEYLQKKHVRLLKIMNDEKRRLKLPELQGLLQKKGGSGLTSHFKERFFKLTLTEIVYYVSHEMVQKIGEVPFDVVSRATMDIDSPPKVKKGCPFAVETTDRKDYILVAEDRSAALAWVSGIERYRRAYAEAKRKASQPVVQNEATMVQASSSSSVQTKSDVVLPAVEGELLWQSVGPGPSVWKQRYFAMNGDRLEYSAAKGQQVLGYIPMRLVTQVTGAGASTPIEWKACGLSILGEQRLFSFLAKSPAESGRWQRILQEGLVKVQEKKMMSPLYGRKPDNEYLAAASKDDAICTNTTEPSAFCVLESQKAPVQKKIVPMEEETDSESGSEIDAEEFQQEQARMASGTIIGDQSAISDFEDSSDEDLDEDELNFLKSLKS